ncbi:EFR1 family ferrodoxin [Prevotella sp. P6B1]|uniref:EFR1 family ferrodoxin n=1 Tax=Prevotella sp. P6B1 TaxID=1410613 RepID=UPI00051AD375|nr:EFR1 family ferrodoxin [Prevotella sp. P6B1]
MIFYFSGTGNTRWVAELIAEAIGEELLFIPESIKQGKYEYELSEGESIGFCFPTHGWQPPRIVREFISRLRLLAYKNQSTPFCWALTTCGDNMGEAMTILNKDLAANHHLHHHGGPLQALTQFSIIMPESYVCLPFMYTDTEEKERAKIATARQQLPHIIDSLRAHKEGVIELEKGATPRLYSYVIGHYFNTKMVNDKKFTVDEDACIKCGKCAKVCPVDNIQGTPPEWIHNGRCTSCLACYHYCPTHAINFGKITRKRGQYYFNKRGDQKS